MCSLIHWDCSWHMFLSPFLRSNGFPVILWAALERTRRVVMYALFCMSLCCISIKRLKILLEGTDGLQLSWNESNASQFMSMKRRYVGMRNALSMVSVRWRTASRMELDKLSVRPHFIDNSTSTSREANSFWYVNSKTGISHVQKNRGMACKCHVLLIKLLFSLR